MPSIGCVIIITTVHFLDRLVAYSSGLKMLYINCSHTPGELFHSQPVKGRYGEESITMQVRTHFAFFLVFVSRCESVQGYADVRAEVTY